VKLTLLLCFDSVQIGLQLLKGVQEVVGKLLSFLLPFIPFDQSISKTYFKLVNLRAKSDILSLLLSDMLARKTGGFLFAFTLAALTLR